MHDTAATPEAGSGTHLGIEARLGAARLDQDRVERDRFGKPEELGEEQKPSDRADRQQLDDQDAVLQGLGRAGEVAQAIEAARRARAARRAAAAASPLARMERR